mgnify:CR=1 FL=1
MGEDVNICNSALKKTEWYGESDVRLKSQGFTLIELIVTVSILAIGAAIAVPGFQNLIQSNRVSTQTNNFISSVKVARSEAVKQGQPVTMRAVEGNFGNGWCIYQGPSGTDCTNATTIREFGEPSGITLDAGGNTTFQFNGQGELETPNTAVTVNVDPKNCSGASNQRRVVSISVIGRPSLAKGNCS